MKKSFGNYHTAKAVLTIDDTGKIASKGELVFFLPDEWFLFRGPPFLPVGTAHCGRYEMAAGTSEVPGFGLGCTSLIR